MKPERDFGDGGQHQWAPKGFTRSIGNRWRSTNDRNGDEWMQFRPRLRSVLHNIRRHHPNRMVTVLQTEMASLRITSWSPVLSVWRCMCIYIYIYIYI